MWRARLNPWSVSSDRIRCRMHYFHIDDKNKEASLWMLFFVTKGKDNSPVGAFKHIHEAGYWYCYVFGISDPLGPFNSRDECRIVGKLHAVEHYFRRD